MITREERARARLAAQHLGAVATLTRRRAETLGLDPEAEVAEMLRGEKGETGERGPEGPRGDVGSQGLRGPAGHDGRAGERGPAGESVVGPAGPAGEDGKDADLADLDALAVSLRRLSDGPAHRTRGLFATVPGVGPTGPAGPAGAAGATGPGNLFIQDTEPALPPGVAKALWVDTSGGNLSFWIVS